MLVDKRKIVFILSVIFFITFVGVLDSDVYGAKKTSPGKVKIKSVSQTRIPLSEYDKIRYIIKQSVRLKWKHAKNADGYVVYRKYKKGKYKAIKNIKMKEAKAAGSILKYTTSEVKKGKYYFKIAAYKLYTGKKYYGKKSSAKGIYVKPKKAVKKWNIGCGSKSTAYGSEKAKKNVKATLYNNGELIISGKGNAQYPRGHVDGDNGGDGYYDGMPWMPRIHGESIYKYIDKVTIKKGVAPKSIYGWFYALRRLKQAPKIPSSVKNMGETFRCCTSLKQAPKIPPGVKYMNSTFADCTSLKQAPKIPSSVKTMYRTFAGCESLKQAPQIPAGVEDMDRTFKGCRLLKQAPQIPAGVGGMSETFKGCESLKQAPQIPAGVEDMYSTFEGCESLKQAPQIPEGVEDMDSTFEGCKSLKQAPQIPAGVEDMDRTFEGCESLEKGPSSIPSSVAYMRKTFRGCKSMTGTIKIKTTLANVTHKDDYDDEYYSCGDCFEDAAIYDGYQIRLDYVDEALVDKILEDVSSPSHVVKGNHIG